MLTFLYTNSKNMNVIIPNKNNNKTERVNTPADDTCSHLSPQYITDLICTEKRIMAPYIRPVISGNRNKKPDRLIRPFRFDFLGGNNYTRGNVRWYFLKLKSSEFPREPPSRQLIFYVIRIVVIRNICIVQYVCII